MRQLARTFWLSNYLRSDSPIRKYLQGSLFLRVLSMVVSLFLAVITYLAIFGYHWLECVAFSAAILAAKRIHSAISTPIDANIAEHLVEWTHIRIFFWISISFVLLTLIISNITVTYSTDHSQLTADQIADKTINGLQHPVKAVQHIVRTVRYMDLQLLKARDTMVKSFGWQYGWSVYFFFLIPNALPAFGLVSMFCGVERVIEFHRISMEKNTTNQTSSEREF